LQTACRDQAALTQQCVRQDALDQYKLQDAKTKAPTNVAAVTAASVSEMPLAQQLEWFRQKKETLERKIGVVNAKTTEISDWLAVASSTTSSSSMPSATKKSMDEICVGASTLQDQMLDLAAENASLSDALYVLDRSLDVKRSQRSTDGTTTSTASSEGLVTDHLRTVRKLAQRQFLVRAHLLKINSSAASRHGH
jgi:ESCRT-I complex subunit TSG101